MAQRMQVIFEDDLDGSEAQGTVSFGFVGTSYEIDLSKKNAARLARIFEPFIASGRRVSARSSTRSGNPSSRSSGPSWQEVRAWAKTEGIEVASKGRVPAELIVRFQSAGQ
jgi:Lsr2